MSSGQSIYEDDFQFKANFDDENGVRCFAISIPGPHAIQLLIHLPLGYPTTDAPVAEVYESFGLTNAQRDQIIQDLVRAVGFRSLRCFDCTTAAHTRCVSVV